mmetsp:Transcript_11217/g.18324  ORF Transcript_11217/g.18324 Transcript_11217/m.18324 type:complete len:307 (+) Transcript_11217:14-934(+)
MAKKKWGGEDTRGLKAKAQKAASRAEKNAAANLAKERAESASWRDSVTDRKSRRKQEKDEKELQRRARLEQKKAILAAEEREMAGMKASKGKRRKAQLAAGASTWAKKNGTTTNGSKLSMKALAQRKIDVPTPFVRKVLVQFYTKHNPEKLENIDKIIEKFEGKWAKLEAGLRKKFPENAPDLESLYSKEKQKIEKQQQAAMENMIIPSEVVGPNVNQLVREERKGGVAVAFGVDDTLQQLGSIVKGSGSKMDRNPEKRRKALFRSYEEREMARLRAENPKLKRSQLKERIFAAWQKSPENPMNQK